MIAGIELGQQAVGVGGVASGLVEIDDFIEVAGSSDPGVDGLAVGFIGCIGVVVVGTGVGQDGAADDDEVVGMGAGDDLLIGGDDALD